MKILDNQPQDIFDGSDQAFKNAIGRIKLSPIGISHQVRLGNLKGLGQINDLIGDDTAKKISEALKCKTTSFDGHAIYLGTLKGTKLFFEQLSDTHDKLFVVYSFGETQPGRFMCRFEGLFDIAPCNDQMMKSGIIWDNYYGEGDKEALDLFQKKIGYTFPSSYLSICEKHNGAYPDNADTFDIIDSDNDKKSLGVGVFLAHGEAEEEYETLEKFYSIKPSGLPENMVPFSLMGDGDIICFNFKSDSEPTIHIWHIETGKPEYIANNFDDFLEMLYEE